LVCAEENALLGEMSRRGVKMFYDPSLVAYHERRPTLRGFAQQMHKYGFGRGQLGVREPATVRPSYLAPAALLAHVVTLPLAVLAVGPVAMVPLAAYGAAVVAAAARIALTLRRPFDAALAGLLVVVLHVAYGLGVIRGTVARRRPVEHPVVLRWHDDRGAEGVVTAASIDL
nr:hypothetical protein [Actinomycetota bacterium]